MTSGSSKSQPAPSIERIDFGRISIYRGSKGGKYPDGNQVTILGSDTRAALDTPIVSNHIGAAFDATELVVMGHVHEDHMAGLHRLPQAEVHVHEADVAAARSWDGLLAAFGTCHSQSAQLRTRLERDFFYAPRPDARSYVDGAVWQLGQTSVRAIHMPGHTAGHTVLLMEPEGVAFIGDIDLTGFGPYYGDACSNLSDFRDTLARLPDIPAKVWVTSHHRGIYTDRSRFLADLAAYVAKLGEREERLISLLRSKPMSIAQLTQQGLLYPPGFNLSWAAEAERRTITQHLNEMRTARIVNVDDAGTYHLN